jgi:hypothetical protein
MAQYILERREVREVHGHGDTDHYVAYDITVANAHDYYGRPTVRVCGEANAQLAQDILKYLNDKDNG